MTKKQRIAELEYQVSALKSNTTMIMNALKFDMYEISSIKRLGWKLDELAKLLGYIYVDETKEIKGFQKIK